MRGAANQSRKKVNRSLCLMLAIMAGLAADAVAQNAAARPDRGIRPVGSYSVSDIESVSLSNGNVHLSIPLASLPPVAGGKLGVTLSASYNSKLWDFKRKERASNVMGSPNFVQDVPQLSDNGGWRIGGTYSLDLRDSRDDFDWLAPPCAPGPGCDPGDIEYCLLTVNSFKKAVLTTPDGSTHELRPVDYSPYQLLHEYLWGYYKDYPDSLCSGPNPCDPFCTTGVMRYYSFDGSFIWAKIYPASSGIRWEIYLPDGTHIVQRNNGQRIYDRTGLYVIRIYSETPDPNNPQWTTTHFVDQVANREIKHIYDATGEHVQYQTYGGIWMSIDMVWGVTTVSGKTYAVQDQAVNGNLCSIQQLLGQNIDVIRSIVLPVTEPGHQQGLSYSFSYNSDGTENNSQTWRGSCGGEEFPLFTASIGWGSLSSMTTPAGAVVNYTYNMDHAHRLHPTQGGESPENQDLPRDSITHKTAAHDGMVDSWDYAIGFVGGTVVAHVAGQPDETTTESCYNHDPGFGDLFGIVDGLGGMSYRTNHSGKEIVNRHWTLKKFYGANDIMPGTLIHPPFNPVVDAEYTTLVDPNNSANNKMSAKVFQYDYNGNMTSETDYDLFDANAVQTDSYGVPTGVPAGVAVLRTATTSYYNPAPVGSDPSPGSPNVYAKRLLADATPRILNAAQETISGASDTRFSYDGGTWPSPPNNSGNLTREERYDNRATSSPTWLATVHAYDPTYGNLISTTDPKLNVTTIGYDANTHAQPTSVTVDPLNGTGSQTTHTTYDFSSGLVIDQTDANQQTTHIDYTNQRLGSVDPYGRPGLVVSPPVTSRVNGVNYTNQSRRTITKYYNNTLPNNAFQVEVISDLNQQSDGLLKARTTVDQMGRTVLKETSEDGSTYTISSRAIYGPMGRVTYSSNPYRSSSATTDGWTRTTRDEIGRVVEVASFAGSTQPPSSGTNSNWTGSLTTAYNAEQSTVTDQAGKKLRSFVDGRGRLRQVDELYESGALYASTSYSYDALNNLTLVQQGVQQRQFAYDSLSRLREAYNPEQQMVATIYEYDEASNLKKRTNPSGSYVSFEYDGFNRPKIKTLSTGGVWNYNYDSGVNFKGRPVSLVKQGSTDGYYYDGYDAVGKISASHQITDGNSYTMSYGYDLAGNITRETYPSGKEVRTSYDNAARVGSVSRYISGALDKTYASFSYCACGATMSATLGNGLKEQTSINSRLQPFQTELRRVSTNELIVGLDYTYSPSGTITSNNGNVLTQTIRIGGTTVPTTTISQSFTYDQVNRLWTATESGAWSQNYGYDRYGNRWLASGYIVPGNEGLTPQFSTDFNTSTNRLNASMYDTSGNQTRDQIGRGFTYDAENHQVTFNLNAGTYIYDGDGRRVKKIDSSGTTLFVYNAVGQLIAEYTAGTPSGSGTSYLTTDHLGSTRVVSDSGGNVKARHDYLPFGEEIPSTVGGRSSIPGYSGNDTTRQRYTGKERDAENDLDYFDTRYMSSAQGRFTSPDLPLIGQHPAHPQSWNLYAYVHNNPCSLIDPDGLDCIYATDNGKGVESIDHNSNSGECGDHGGTWVPGNVNENNVVYNEENEMFQAASNDGTNVYYSTFASGARTRENGTCATGCDGADIQHANAAWLSSMIAGKGSLDEMMHFMVARANPIHGILFRNSFGAFMERLLSGGLDPGNNNWAGPSGMGPPHGQSDWSAMVHDYNFEVNDIKIGSYFNPSISKATAKALTQSNRNLIRNVRGIQKIKFGLFFGIVNAFQSYVQSWK